jgi:hypothetical protein
MGIFSLFQRGRTVEKALPEPDVATPEPQAKHYSNQDIANYMMDDDSPTQADSTRGLNYGQLNSMTKIPLIAAIIQTRINQVAEFARPAMGGGDIGFKIRLKNRASIPTDEDLEIIQELYSFMLQCGDNRLSFESNFESFLRMLVRDSLTYDQACFEVIRNRRGDIAGFMNIDSATVRRTRLTKDERDTGRRDPTIPQFVQVVDNKVQAQWNAKELCFGVRRPRSDLRFRGYGYPELEDVVSILTHLLNAETYNASNFTNGISVAGIVAVKSKMHPQLFRSFRREFYSMLSGSHNAKKTPLVQLDPDSNEDLKALNLSSTNKEMEFQHWIHYNIKQLCAIYQIDPSEVGFDFGQEGVRHTFNQLHVNHKIISSKEKGLRPMLRAIECWLNQYIVNELNSRFELVFTGLDMLPVKEQIEMDALKGRAFMTIDELRSEHDLAPLPDGKGSVIMNSAYIQGMGFSDTLFARPTAEEQVSVHD